MGWPFPTAVTGLALALLFAAWTVRRLQTGERRLLHSNSQLEALHAASLSITGNLSPEAVLRNLVTAARELAGARFCALGIVPENGGPPDFVVSGLPSSAEASMSGLPVRGLRALVLESGRPVRVGELSAHPAFAGFPPDHPPMHSLLAVPIVSHGKVLGAIYAAQKEHAAEFSAEDEQMLTRLANQAAAAVENARLYREARQARERLERLIQGSRDAIVLMDSAGRVELWNRGAELLYGLTADQAMGKVLPYTHTEHRAGSDDRLRRARSGERVDGEEGFHRRPDGSPLPVLVSVSRVEGGPGEEPRLLMIAREMTAWKRLEVQRRRLALLEERDRIGMDLHDGAIQELYAVGLGLEAVRRRLPPDLQATADGLGEATAELNRVIGDLRSYILDQRPRSLTGRGLQAELEGLAARLRDEGGVAVRMEMAVLAEPPGDVTGQLLNIAAEALSNVLRHSGAATVTVSLRVTATEAVLSVRDDGCGFEPDAAAAKGRLGLRNMRARTQSLGGEFHLASRPGAGTEVRVQVPLEGEEQP